jgi:hypothetical protein
MNDPEYYLSHSKNLAGFRSLNIPPYLFSPLDYRFMTNWSKIRDRAKYDRYQGKRLLLINHPNYIGILNASEIKHLYRINTRQCRYYFFERDNHSDKLQLTPYVILKTSFGANYCFQLELDKCSDEMCIHFSSAIINNVKFKSIHDLLAWMRRERNREGHVCKSRVWANKFENPYNEESRNPWPLKLLCSAFIRSYFHYHKDSISDILPPSLSRFVLEEFNQYSEFSHASEVVQRVQASHIRLRVMMQRLYDSYFVTYSRIYIGL